MKYTLRPLFDTEQFPTQTEPKLKNGKNLLSFPDNYVVLDIETTGLNPKFNEIIELSALKVENGHIVEEFNQLVKPKGAISPFITNLTGINKEMLAEAPNIKEAIIKFNDFCSDSVVLGHNISFDLKFINTTLLKYHNITFDNDYIDSLRIARILLPSLSNKKLGTIAGYFNFDTNGMHRGLKDCKVTYMCFCKFKEMVIEKYGSVDNFLKN